MGSKLSLHIGHKNKGPGTHNTPTVWLWTLQVTHSHTPLTSPIRALYQTARFKSKKLPFTAVTSLPWLKFPKSLSQPPGSVARTKPSSSSEATA